MYDETSFADGGPGMAVVGITCMVRVELGELPGTQHWETVRA